MKQTPLLLFILIIFSSCFIGNSNQKIDNISIDCRFDTVPEEIQISLIPYPNYIKYINKTEPINIGKIKDEKMTIIFPKYIDTQYLFDPADTHFTVTKGLKFMRFYSKPYIKLINNETSEDIFDLGDIVYSNKTGKMKSDETNEEYFFKKGWNIFSENKNIILKEFSKPEYKWLSFNLY